MPRSIGSSNITIFGVELTVHNLDDGRRIIEADGMNALFEMLMAGDLALGEILAADLADVLSPAQQVQP